MDSRVADEQAYVLRETLSWDQARERARDKKTTMFGTFSRFFKGEDIEIAYSECRYEPFWHVVCNSHYVYDCNHTWMVAVSDPEVRRITIRGEDLDVGEEQPVVLISGIEHCREGYHRDVRHVHPRGKHRCARRQGRGRLAQVLRQR